MSPDQKPDTRCSVCETEFRQADLPPNTGCCPACGSNSVPQNPDEDVTLTLNWLDVRCLAEWSERWVHANPGNPEWERHWEALKRRLRKHRPAGAAPLTFFEEVEEIREDGHDITVHDVPPRFE